jgi:hypothetical protein
LLNAVLLEAMFVVQQRMKPVEEPPLGLSTAPRRAGREKFRPDRSKRLRDQVHQVMRYFHYSWRTEEAYWHWIERFLRFHKRGAAWPPKIAQRFSAG